MRIVINFLAILLSAVALLSLTLPVATFGKLLSQPDSSKLGLLFALPALLFSVAVAVVVFRHFCRRDVGSAKSIITAFCFFLWLILNTVSMDTHRLSDPERWELFLFHFATPMLVAVLLNRLLDKLVDRAYRPTNSAGA